MVWCDLVVLSRSPLQACTLEGALLPADLPSALRPAFVPRGLDWQRQAFVFKWPFP